MENQQQVDVSLVIQSLLRQIAQQAERIAILEAQLQPQQTVTG
jgi:hypothetical protein